MLLERQPAAGSHDRGRPKGLPGNGLTWETTMWRQGARNGSDSLSAQFLQLLEDLPPKCSELVAGRVDDIVMSVDVAVFYEEAYGTLCLSSDLIDELARKGVGVEATFYPVTPEE
jgi:hypothetical protein